MLPRHATGDVHAQFRSAAFTPVLEKLTLGASTAACKAKLMLRIRTAALTVHSESMKTGGWLCSSFLHFIQHGIHQVFLSLTVKMSIVV